MERAEFSPAISVTVKVRSWPLGNVPNFHQQGRVVVAFRERAKRLLFAVNRRLLICDKITDQCRYHYGDTPQSQAYAMIRRGMNSVYLIIEALLTISVHSRIPAFPVLHPLAHSKRIPCYQSHPRYESEWSRQPESQSIYSALN